MRDLREHFEPAWLGSCLSCRALIGVEKIGLARGKARTWNPSMWERRTIKTLLPGTRQDFGPHRHDGHATPHECRPKDRRKARPVGRAEATLF